MNNAMMEEKEKKENEKGDIIGVQVSGEIKYKQ